MRKKSILVVSDVDFAHESVFDRGLALAQQIGADLHVVHPVPLDHPLSFRSNERFRRLTEMRLRAKHAGVHGHMVVRQGPAAEMATDYGTARSVDLLIVGAERREGWRRVGAPSLAEGVVRLAKQPTLVLPVDDHAGPPRFDRVVVAVDQIDRAAALMTLAADVLGRPARELTVLHAVASLEASTATTAMGRWLVPEYRHHILAHALQELEQAIDGHVDTATETHVRVAAGGAFDTIVNHAADDDADLIVVGASARMLRSASVPARLVRRADRPLLIIPAIALAAARLRASRAGKHVA